MRRRTLDIFPRVVIACAEDPAVAVDPCLPRDFRYSGMNTAAQEDRRARIVIEVAKASARAPETKRQRKARQVGSVKSGKGENATRK